MFRGRTDTGTDTGYWIDLNFFLSRGTYTSQFSDCAIAAHRRLCNIWELHRLNFNAFTELYAPPVLGLHTCTFLNVHRRPEANGKCQV